MIATFRRAPGLPAGVDHAVAHLFAAQFAGHTFAKARPGGARPSVWQAACCAMADAKSGPIAMHIDAQLGRQRCNMGLRLNAARELAAQCLGPEAGSRKAGQ